MPLLVNPYWYSKYPDTWVRQITSPGASFSYPSSVVTDIQGNVYHTVRFPAVTPNPVSNGWATVTKFSPSGDVLWVKDLNKFVGFENNFFPANPSGFFTTVGPEGFILVSGHSSQGPGFPVSSYHKVICLNHHTGQLKWAKGVDAILPSAPYGNQVSYAGVQVNPVTGHIYLAMDIGDFPTSLGVITIDSSGSVTGSLRLNSGRILRGIVSRLDGSIVILSQHMAGDIYSGYWVTSSIVLSPDGSTVLRPTLFMGSPEIPSISFKGVFTTSQSLIVPDYAYKKLYALNSDGSALSLCKDLFTTFGNGGNSLDIKELPNGQISVLSSRIGSYPYNDQWIASNNFDPPIPPNLPTTSLVILSEDLSQIVVARQSGIGTSSGTFNIGYCVGTTVGIGRHVGCPGGFAVTSMNSKPIFSSYDTLPDYPATGGNDTFAKFASSTSSLPIDLLSAPSPPIFDPGILTSSMVYDSYDYSASVNITDNTELEWSFFKS